MKKFLWITVILIVASLMLIGIESHTALAITMPENNNVGIPDLLNSTFADKPIMIDISKCESGQRQFDNQGQPLIGGGNYVGIFQISKGHIQDAQSRGIDIYTVDGNIAYAKYLYTQSSTAPWKGCLKTTTPINKHSVGTNVIWNGTVYYLSADGLVPYSSPEVFQSYGFNSWTQVAPANNEDLKLAILSHFMNFADGTLVKDSGTVYVISGGKKYGISSADVFLKLGYSWSSIVSGDSSFMPIGTVLADNALANPHLPGTLLNIKATIYYVAQNSQMAFPSMEVFNSWEFKLSHVVDARQSDIPANTTGTSLISNWTIGKLIPYN